MTNAAQKTPISLLQELCAQQGMTPDYKLMSVEGAVHAPTFMYRVQVNEVVATATGQSKKKAKHAAAKAILERLLGKDGEFSQGFQSDGVTVNAETLNEVISEPTVAPPADENAEDNPVGKLQEHCMKNRWQPPYYETENATGLPHEKIFTIVCFVGDFTTTGEGKSKRLAKRQAAAKMLERLNSMKEVSKKEEEMAKGDTLNEDEAVTKNSSVVDEKDVSVSSLADKLDDMHVQSSNDTENNVTSPSQETLSVSSPADKLDDMHAQSSNDIEKNVTSPIQETLSVSPLADKLDDMHVQSSNDTENNVTSPSQETVSVSSPADKLDDMHAQSSNDIEKNVTSPIQETLSVSPLADKLDDMHVQSSNGIENNVTSPSQETLSVSFPADKLDDTHAQSSNDIENNVTSPSQETHSSDDEEH